MTTLLAILGSIALVAAIEGVRYTRRYLADRRMAEVSRRLQLGGADARADATDILRRGRFARTPWLDAALRSAASAQRLEALLEQADSRLTVAQVLGTSCALALGGVLAVGVLGRGLALGAIAGAIGAAAPLGSLLLARDRRSRRISEQLPEALDMMARSLRAGHALSSAFQVVASEMPEPINLEFARAFEEQRLGLGFDQAVTRMSGRSPTNGDLKIFAVTTVIQKETGGNLAELLDNIARTIRERYKFHGKLRALTGEGRASGLILGALPFVVALLLTFVNPGYLVRLVDNPLGKAILAYAILSWALGLAWMARMSRVEL
jgi:tight adherence protein B